MADGKEGRELDGHVSRTVILSLPIQRNPGGGGEA